MRLKWLGVLFILILVLVGCQSIPENKPVSNPSIIPDSGIFEPLTKPTQIPWQSPNDWVTAMVNISNMRVGALADTWTSDKVLDNGYRYSAGQPLCFTIYNSDPSVRGYDIGLDNGDYGQPSQSVNWVSIATNHVDIPAKTAMDIPVKIQIPESYKLPVPKQWEFRYTVVPAGQGNIQYAMSVRFIVTMR